MEDLTFQFRFSTVDQGLSVMAGTKSIPVPLSNLGPLSATSTAAQNVYENYTLTLVQGNRRSGMATPITDATTGSKTFTKPFDNIGAKSIPNYATYANSFIPLWKSPFRAVTQPGQSVRRSAGGRFCGKSR